MGSTMASSANCVPASHDARRRSRLSTLFAYEPITTSSLVDDRHRQLGRHRPAARRVGARAVGRARADVLGLEVAAVAVADLGPEEEEREAVEGHRVAAVLELLLLDDGDEHEAAAGDGVVARRLLVPGLAVVLVPDVLLDVLVGRVGLGVHPGDVLVEARVDALPHRARRLAGLGVLRVDRAGAGALLDALRDVDAHVLAAAAVDRSEKQ